MSIEKRFNDSDKIMRNDYCQIGFNLKTNEFLLYQYRSKLHNLLTDNEAINIINLHQSNIEREIEILNAFNKFNETRTI